MLSDRLDGIRSRPPLSYYTAELTPLVDGTVFVSVSLSTTKGGNKFETEMVNEDIVDTMRDALSLIEESVVEKQASPR